MICNLSSSSLSMRQCVVHPWDLSPQAAERLQAELAGKVVLQDDFSKIETVAGVDVAYDQHSQHLVAAAVVLDARTLAVLERSVAMDVERFPYIPGLFSFRELPPLVKALEQLKQWPDLIVCDGQGIAHPRRFGLACHLGVLFDVPAIGCGKTRLLGEAMLPGDERGESAPLEADGEVIGSVLRTQKGVKPVYVSVGHKLSLTTACEWVLRLAPKYRLPETTRMADQAVRASLKGMSA